MRPKLRLPRFPFTSMLLLAAVLWTGHQLEICLCDRKEIEFWSEIVAAFVAISLQIVVDRSLIRFQGSTKRLFDRFVE